MSRIHLRVMLACASALGASVFIAEPAQAQATRTWVSGVGDDANPCSRTAPCKTFAGAISKTAAGGEINCLDPGGFGGVTITKSISILCSYTEGGVLVAGAGVSGITINAGAADVVYLRGLDIFGVGTATNGVRFFAGSALHIEDSIIRRFNAANGQGVLFQPSGAATLTISNSTISNNGSAGAGGGILIQPTGAGGSARVTLSNVRINNNNGAGVRVETSGNTSLAGNAVAIVDSELNGNVQGLLVNTPASTTTAAVMVTGSAINFNTSRGILAGGATAVVRVGNTTITGNATGLQSGTGAVINTYGDNRLDGNTPDGAFTLPALPKE